MASDFRNPQTRIMYMVAINETTRTDMQPVEIASLLEDGFELDIVIRPELYEYDPADRVRMIYG